jgi:hypothetical protein
MAGYSHWVRCANTRRQELLLQDLIKQKQTLLELKKEVYDKVEAQHQSFAYLWDEIEQFKIFWGELIDILNKILNFCYNRKIVLNYESRNTTVAEWYKPYGYQRRGDQTVMYIFEMYLKSSFVSDIPKAHLEDFHNWHRQATQKFEDVLSII